MANFALTFDNENHEDVYQLYPSEREIMDARLAAPDAWTRVHRLEDGWRRVLHDEWPPINDEFGGGEK